MNPAVPEKARLSQGHLPWASTSAEEPDGATLLVEGDAVGTALRCAWGQAFQIPELNYLIERLLDTSLQSLFRFGMLKLKHQTATAFGINNNDIGTAVAALAVAGHLERRSHKQRRYKAMIIAFYFVMITYRLQQYCIQYIFNRFFVTFPK